MGTVYNRLFTSTMNQLRMRNEM